MTVTVHLTTSALLLNAVHSTDVAVTTTVLTGNSAILDCGPVYRSLIVRWTPTVLTMSAVIRGSVYLFLVAMMMSARVAGHALPVVVFRRFSVIQMRIVHCRS